MSSAATIALSAHDAPSSAARPRGHNDWWVLLTVLGLMFFSTAFVYSASSGVASDQTGSSETFFWNHALRVAVAIGVLLVTARIDYHWLERWSKPMLVVSLGLLLYVLFDGTQIKGATRWVSLGPISFQPSELAKYALVLHLGVMLSDKKRYLDDLRYALLPMLVWIGMTAALVALQPNMSTATVIFVVAMATLFIGGVSMKHLGTIVATGLGAAALYAVSAPYRMRRLMAYAGMHSGGADSATVSDANYQLHQGLLAFGSGGVFGVGPGQSRQRLFVPEPFGDFIYSIIGEEYGLVGTLALLIVFGVIVWRGLLIARRAPDALGRNVAAGITVVLALYAIINACVTTGLTPTTGLPMPFVSYGGSAVIFSAAAVGVLLNISQHANVMPIDRAEVKG